MLKLKINTPEGEIFSGNVKEVVVPTEDGEIGILPWHIPLVSVVKPWIVKILPKDNIVEKEKFIFEKEWINISVSRWLIFTDGKIVLLTVSKSVINPEKSIEVLQQMKQDLEKQIQQLKAKGEIEELDKALLMMQTVEAEIKLMKKKWIL